MKIELKNIKYASFASQETYCFEATLYINGKKRGSVYNEGHGGSNFYGDYDAEQELDAYGKTLPKTVCSYGEFEQDAESLINDLLEDHLATKQLKAKLKNRVVYLDGGKIWQTPTYPKQDLPRAIMHLQSKGHQVLNTMPADRALALFKGAAA